MDQGGDEFPAAELRRQTPKIEYWLSQLGNLLRE